MKRKTVDLIAQSEPEGGLTDWLCSENEWCGRFVDNEPRDSWSALG